MTNLELLHAMTVAANSQNVNLFAYPAVEPTTEQWRTVRACHARAAQLGLLVPSDTQIRFVRATGAPIHGQTQRLHGVVEVALVASLSLDALREVVLHELAHVDQYARGLMESMTFEDREWAAVSFAERAMQGWQV